MRGDSDSRSAISGVGEAEANELYYAIKPFATPPRRPRVTGSVGGVLESMHGLGEAGTLFSIFALSLSFVIVVVAYALAAMRALIGGALSRKRA